MPVGTPVTAYSALTPVSIMMVEPTGIEVPTEIEAAPTVVPAPDKVVDTPGVQVSGPIMPRRKIPATSG